MNEKIRFKENGAYRIYESRERDIGRRERGPGQFDSIEVHVVQWDFPHERKYLNEAENSSEMTKRIDPPHWELLGMGASHHPRRYRLVQEPRSSYPS